MAKCKYKSTYEFYIDDEEGNSCCDICTLKVTNGTFYEDSIINEEVCYKCNKREVNSDERSA